VQGRSRRCEADAHCERARSAEPAHAPPPPRSPSTERHSTLRRQKNTSRRRVCCSSQCGEVGFVRTQQKESAICFFREPQIVCVYTPWLQRMRALDVGVHWTELLGIEIEIEKEEEGGFTSHSHHSGDRRS
jgi:hypothetical protein